MFHRDISVRKREFKNNGKLPFKHNERVGKLTFDKRNNEYCEKIILLLSSASLFP